MKAMIIKGYGEPDVFEAADIDIPPLKAGYVRVRVKATSINPVDCKIRKLGPPTSPELPAVLHCDMAGVVEEVGAGVTKFAVGDRVFGCPGGVKGEEGALAEMMNADADFLARIPDSIDFKTAAALPLVCITAWEGLVDKANVQPGQKVLIHAATGGVGHVAIQIAKARGADVYATVSGDEKAAIATKLGATPINYRELSVSEYVDQHTGGAGFDIVYDTVGGDNIPKAWEAVRRNGTVVSCQSNATHDMTPIHAKGITFAGVLMLLPILFNQGRAHHGEIMEQIAAMAEKGDIAPLIDDKSFDLDHIADAHAHWESGSAIGKIVITVGD